MQRIKAKKLTLGIVGGGPKSWIGHVHRISSRFDNQYEIVAGVFSRNPSISKKFGKNWNILATLAKTLFYIFPKSCKPFFSKFILAKISIRPPQGEHA